MPSTRGGWKIKKTTIGYKSPWVSVFEDHGTRPDGKPGMHLRVKIRDGLSVLPIDPKGNVFLIHEFHYGLGRTDIQTASGALGRGENPLRGAKRELQEELGIRARKWISLGVTNPHTGLSSAAAYLFLAQDLDFGKQHLEGTETIRTVRMSLARAVQLVMRGQITHGPSCVLILKAREYLTHRK